MADTVRLVEYVLTSDQLLEKSMVPAAMLE